MQYDYSAAWDDRQSNFCSSNPINLCSHHPDQQNTALKNHCLLLCFLDFILLSWFPGCSGISLSVSEYSCMRMRKRKGRARESCINAHTSNNKRGFRESCRLWPVISVVLSPPCRRTRSSFEVSTFLHKYTSIYLLTAHLLGMPLGHTSTENLNEGTTIMTLIVKPVKFTTLPQWRKENPNQQYAMQETLMLHQQTSAWKCQSNHQTLHVLARNSTFTMIFLVPPPAHAFCPEDNGNTRFSLLSCHPGLSPWSNSSARKGILPNTLGHSSLPQTSGFPAGIQLQNQGLVYRTAQSSLFLQGHPSKYIKLLQLTATYVCGNCILFLVYFSLQAKNNSMNVQGYEDYGKLRALHIWTKASAERRVARAECRYFHLACINFVFLINSS